MKMTEITTTHGDDQFYPTPPSVAEKMLEGIDWAMIKTILEPSAGKGDLILEAARAKYKKNPYSRYDKLDVDAVEIDPYLREICKYNFSEEKKNECYYNDEWEKLRGISYTKRTPEQDAELKRLEREAEILESVALHMVHDDFLTYRTYKHYDLILMNPPFADGDKHLLKALEMQKDGGMVVCLLNAETILNPYTKSRELLKRKLKELDAEISFIEDAFSTDAERKARVNTAIVRVDIPKAVHESTLFERMKKAAEEEHIPDAELNALIPSDYIEQAICLYNAEVAATMELIKEYEALKPYITRSLSKKEYGGSDPIITLFVKDDNSRGGLDTLNTTLYMRCVRLKYWRALFENEQFIGRLTTNLRKQFKEQVDRMADYEFSAFNIKQVMVEMNASMQQGLHETILSLFEKLTVEHSWYPECAQNRHYYNGWKTNKAHKVSKKSIIPANGLFSSYSWDKDKGFDLYAAYNVLIDIEKAFDYLDGGHFTGNRYNLESFLKYASERRQNRNIECTYFTVDIYKKGTVHIKFRPEAMPLVDRLNIYAARGKNWLPPSYGNTTYSTMDAEEKAVVDSFHGDGTEGSGEKAYAEILKDTGYYLSDPTNQMAALAAPGA